MIEVLDNVPFKLHPDQILKSLGSYRSKGRLEEMVVEMVNSAATLGRPKAIYRTSHVVCQGWDSVEIDQIRFQSRVLRVNLAAVNIVFPYIITSGRELATIAPPTEEVVARYCLDTIKSFVLLSAIGFVSEYLKEKYALGKTAHMSPGSLDDWPIAQQAVLFSLFGNVEQSIGVKLSKSYMMQPLKSISGILFASDTNFQSCRLCSRERCSGRRAPYDDAEVMKYDPMGPHPS